MTDSVRVPVGDDGETAAALLKAADDKGYGPEVVRLSSHSTNLEFEVPADVAKAAKAEVIEEEPPVEEQAAEDQKSIEQEAEDRGEESHSVQAPESEQPRKRAAAKTAPKKSTRNKG